MKFMDILNRVMAQVTSGRWLITVTAAFCLVLLTKTLCALMIEGKVLLESSTYVAIVMSILNVIGTISVFYFQKPRIAEDSNGETTTTVSDSSTTTTGSSTTVSGSQAPEITTTTTTTL